MASGCSFLELDIPISLIGQEQGIHNAVSSFSIEIKLWFAQYWSSVSLESQQIRERMGGGESPITQSVSIFTAHPAEG